MAPCPGLVEDHTDMSVCMDKTPKWIAIRPITDGCDAAARMLKVCFLIQTVDPNSDEPLSSKTSVTAPQNQYQAYQSARFRQIDTGQHP